MASINKLSIRGVRSFSPNDDEQVIAFCFPLTIIVGANGCGKTTIIESLKYAVTGSLPPGKTAGQSFVHDPRSIGQSSVKASIKLRFTNTEGLSMVVSRTMEVAQKKTTASFKALDGTIRTVNNDTGERVTMSHKCTELDKNVPMFLGVSKPILEHVVFCHQEDSSWPLQEGAVLKKRFDDIFDSTRYAKALDAIKAERKNYAALAKDLKADLEGLKSHKHAATGFREDLEGVKDKISDFEDKIKAANDLIEKEREKAREAQAVLGTIQDFETSLNYKKGDIDTQEAVMNKQRSLLGKDDLTDQHSYQELKEMLRELSDQRHGNEATRSLQEKEAEYTETERQVDKLRKKLNDLNSRKGKLEAEREAHSNVLRSRFKVMEDIHRTYNIEMDSMTQTQDDDTMTQGSIMSRSTIFTSATNNTNAITQEDLDAFQRAVDGKKADLSDGFNNAKQKHRKDEDDMQKDILKYQAEKAAIENDRKRNDATKNDAMKELHGVGSQMSSHTRVSASDVEEAKKEAEKVARDRDDMNKHPRREQITKELRVQDDKLKSISAKIEADTKVRDQLRLKADEQNEIDMLDKQCNQEYETLEQLLSDNSFLISEQGENCTVNKEDPVSPVEVLANNVRDKTERATQEIESYNSDVVEVQAKVSEAKAMLNNHKERFGKLHQAQNSLLADGSGVQKIKNIIRAILRQDKDGIDLSKVNEDSSPTDILKFIDAQVKLYSGYDENPENISKLVKRLKKMAKSSMECPCCTRTFADESEVNTFQARMSELGDPDVSELHALAAKKSAEVRDVLTKYESWRKGVSENMHSYLEYIRTVKELKEVEAIIQEEEGDGRGKLKDLESQLGKANEALSEKKEDMVKLQSLMRTVTVIQDTANRVWDKMGNVKEKKQKLQFQFFDNLDDGRDLKTVEKDLARSSDEKETAYNTINGLNNEQKSLNDKISRITNTAAAAERTAREKEELYKREQESSKRKNELNDLLQKCSAHEKEIDKQLLPLRTRLLQAETDRKRMRDTNSKEDKDLGDKLKCFERDMDRLTDVNEKIELYVRSNKDREVEEVDQRLLNAKEDIGDGERKLTDMKPQLESLKKQVDDGERQMKTIQDNIDLVKLERHFTKLQEEIKKLESELASMGGNDAKEKYKAASTEIRERQIKIERWNGRLQGFGEEKRNIKKKLGEAEYKNVDERHRMKMIEHETTNIVVTDLDKYYDALDKALLRYHGMKISDINKIIRELWALTYKGEDITNIEIQSGQDTGSRANRSYNYRIVMSKGNSQMDMRGRCSAGQRVLASIVIRLALAETFCLNCGVIALDEPTTNLDHENKRGLAIALGQIIANRAAQTNFQLLVITHDEDFVSMMKLELASQAGFSMPERYYQVAREESSDGRFYSKITAIDWDDL